MHDTHSSCVENRGQLVGVGALLPPCMFTHVCSPCVFTRVNICAQVVGLGGKHLYTLNHFSDPIKSNLYYML